jgi:hypothetical protein
MKPLAAASASVIAQDDAQQAAAWQQQQQDGAIEGNEQQQQQGGAAGQDMAQLPLSSEQQQQQQLCYCLPASLISLCFKGSAEDGQGDNFLEAMMLENWIMHAAGAPKIQQLHLRGFRVGPAYLDGFLEGVDFSTLPSLTELRCTFLPDRDMEGSKKIELPASLTSLSNLELLCIGTEASPFPWQQHFWVAGEGFLGELSRHCTKLREIWNLAKYLTLGGPPMPMELFQLTSLYNSLKWGEDLAWLTPQTLPQLRHLTLDCQEVTTQAIATLAQLTGLTFLRIDTGPCYVIGNPGRGWCKLDALGKGLTGLQRLEIGNHHGKVGGGDMERSLPALLTLPNLSAFTQIKQLRLMCVVNPRMPMPQHPSTGDLLSCLSSLTQLEQLQVSGYSAVDLGLIGALVKDLPMLLDVDVERPPYRSVGSSFSNMPAVAAGEGMVHAAAAGEGCLEGAAAAGEALGPSAPWPPPMELVQGISKLRLGLKLNLM